MSLQADTQGKLTWGAAGIMFDRDGALWVVPPEGGTARALTTLDTVRHEVSHDNAVALPDGRFVLFTCQTTEPGAERIEAVSLTDGRRSVVMERASTPVWSATGHMVFARDGAVLAVALDPLTATAYGTAIPLMKSGAVESLSTGNLGLDLSPSGTLLYRPSGFTDTRVMSVGRDGAARALNLPPGRYTNPRLAPDGRRLLVENAGNVVQAFDLERGMRTSITTAAMFTLFSAWNADGTRVVFKRLNRVFWAATDGSGTTGLVPGATINDFPSSVGPTPDSFIALRIRPDSSADIFLESISGAFESKPLVVTPAYDGGPQLSPDGRWLLYQSAVSGQPEVYVRRYPALDRPWQVSAGEGAQPRWSRTGREVYYRGHHDIVAVTFDPSGAEPMFGNQTPLFADEYEFGAGTSIANYDVMADGRFVMIRRGASGGRLGVVVNWTDELRQLLASGAAK